jgi:predicted nucleic acid-binding protein
VAGSVSISRGWVEGLNGVLSLDLSHVKEFIPLAAFCDAVADGLVQLMRDEELAHAALLLALHLDHKLPECLYLALAQRHGCALVTADRRLSELAVTQGVETLLVPSA